MRLVPINEAEAMLTPFFEDHPGGGGETDFWHIACHPEARMTRAFPWLGLCYVVHRPVTAAPLLTAESDCDIRVDGYDRLIVFAQIPHWMTLSVIALVDGGRQTVLPPISGTDTFDEFGGPLRGRRLRRLRLEIRAAEPRPGLVTIAWVGLVNRSAEIAMEHRPSPYDDDWSGLLLPNTPDRIEPHLGLFFDAQGLAVLRRRCRRGPAAMAFAALRREAGKDLPLVPERDIGEFVPTQSVFFARRRDRRKVRTRGRMERLALVGLVEGDPRKLRLAARMALSAAHCQYWCEGPQTVFPGSTWRHKAFVESEYTQACALVLDWAGCVLTPRGREVLRQAIVRKGLPGIEATLRGYDDVWRCNQGVVFSSARILGLLALVRHYPRYQPVLAEAERDWRRLLRAYVQADGGTLEGMGYWCYTFGEALPAWFALARFRGQDPAGDAPAELHRTAAFGLSLRSTVADGTRMLPINDARPSPIPSGVAAAFARLTGDPAWSELYDTVVRSTEAAPSPWSVVLAPLVPPHATRPKDGGWRVFPQSGHVASIRRDPRLGRIHFHFYSGPTLFTHFHEDKGSFLLEVEDEPLALDRGITPYDHPETARLKWAALHNLLYPEPRAEEERMAQPADARGGRLVTALQKGDWVLMAGDQCGAWPPGVFEWNVRRIFSPISSWFLFDDDVRLRQPRAVSFLWNTRAHLEPDAYGVWLRGDRVQAYIRPLNWRPQIEIGPEGVDSDLQPVNLLRLRSPVAREHRLLTAVEILPAPESRSPWTISVAGSSLRAGHASGWLSWGWDRPGCAAMTWKPARGPGLSGRFVGAWFRSSPAKKN